MFTTSQQHRFNFKQWTHGFRHWKARHATYVAAQWSPAQGLTAVVCKTTGQGRPQVLASHHLPQAELTLPHLSALAQSLAASRLPWVWVLDRQDYVLLVLDKPPLPPSEMSSGMAWALEPRIDYPTEEATVAWMAIPQPNAEQGVPQVYAVAARRKLVEQRRSLFDAAKIALEVVDIPETAQRHIAALLEQDDECLAMLSFESAGALLTFTWRGELYLHRFIVQPLKDIDRAQAGDRDNILARLIRHYRQSLDFLAQKYDFLRVSRLVVGPAPFAWDVVPELAHALPHAVESIDLSEWMDFDDLSPQPSAATQARLWTVLGAPLRREEVRG